MTTKQIMDEYAKWLMRNKPREPKLVQISLVDWESLAEATRPRQPDLADEMLATKEGRFINAIFMPSEQLVPGIVHIT